MRASFDYSISETRIEVVSLQIETDLVVESNSDVVVCEAKSRPQSDFAVGQLYLPFRYYDDLREKGEIPGCRGVRCLYVVRAGTSLEPSLRMYEYAFPDKMRPESMSLVKKAQYDLRVR